MQIVVPEAQASLMDNESPSHQQHGLNVYK